MKKMIWVTCYVGVIAALLMVAASAQHHDVTRIIAAAIIGIMICGLRLIIRLIQ